jgi:lipopolysaccharide transport system permease protein
MQVGGDRFEGHMGYALFLFSGLIVFNVFGEVATESPRLIIQNPNLVKKVVFPLELLPPSQVGAAVFHSLLSLVILLAAMLAAWGFLHWTIIFIPLIYVPLVILSVGVGWLLASLGVFLRDIGNAIAIIVQLLFFLTPILYTVEQVPEALRGLMWLNPMASIVDDFRRVVREGLPPQWLRLAAVTGVSCLIALAGYVWFMKIKRAFADAL